MYEYTVSYYDANGWAQSYSLWADSLAQAKAEAHAWADCLVHPVYSLKVQKV